jgi:hypothetical protein
LVAECADPQSVQRIVADFVATTRSTSPRATGTSVSWCESGRAVPIAPFIRIDFYFVQYDRTPASVGIRGPALGGDALSTQIQYGSFAGTTRSATA